MEKELDVQPQNFEDRIIFMSMYNDTDWTRKGNQEVCVNISSRVVDFARNFHKGHGSLLGQGCEEKWYATLAHKPNGIWDRVAVEMMSSTDRSSEERAFCPEKR